jgi:hypothetical protein
MQPLPALTVFLGELQIRNGGLISKIRAGLPILKVAFVLPIRPIHNTARLSTANPIILEAFRSVSELLKMTGEPVL